MVCFRVPGGDVFEVSFGRFFFFSFENLLSENGTSVREVPVHLKAGVWNLASCLLPAKAAASETPLLRWRVESWKACVYLERVCVSMHVSSYTRAPQGGQFMGQRVFMGKDGGRLVLVFLGAMRNFINFSFGNNTTADRWRKIFASPLLCCWLYQSSKPPRAQPSAIPSSGTWRLWWIQMCRLLALCSAPRASCGSLGAGVGTCSLLPSCPNCSRCTSLGSRVVSVSNRLRFLP